MFVMSLAVHLYDSLRSTTLTIIYVLETLFGCQYTLFRQDVFCQRSWTANILLFDKTSVRTYIFAFWLIRSFVLNIEGQSIYSFVLSFHSILIFATDKMDMCGKVLL